MDTFTIEPRHADAGFAPSFLDDVKITFGPRAQLGRYFLAAEKHLADHGIRVQFAAFDAIARLNAEHRQSWDMLLPMLDPAQNPVHPEDAIAFLAYDEAGRVVSSMAARLYDFGGTTFRDAVESLQFYYGPGADQMRSRVQSSICAPTAATMTGRAAYLGGYWLRPDVRAQGLSTILPKLMRYIALTRWNADLEFSFGRDKFLRPEIAKTYGFEHVERDFEFHLDGRLIWRGVLVWSDRDELLSQLAALVAANVSTRRALPLDRGSRQQKPATGA